jgi:hypothetical protein
MPLREPPLRDLRDRTPPKGRQPGRRTIKIGVLREPEPARRRDDLARKRSIWGSIGGL